MTDVASAGAAGIQVRPAPAPAVEMRGIEKHFGPVHANRAVSLSVAKGTIHGIVGENGAGKSTLMSILYGFYEADAGEILIDGQPAAIRSSSDAIARGIGMVHQHFMLVEPFTVLENVMLGAEGGARLKAGVGRARGMLHDLEQRYGLRVDPDAIVGDLPVGLQQRVEILKALYRGAETLILDEPTGVLTPQEADELFRILAALRSQGKTIILITHKLREIMAITDAVTVMRQGAVVADVATAATGREQLAELMVGRKVLLRVDKGIARPGAPLLEVRGLEVVDARGVRRVKDVSFTVRAGEIVGIAGVSGNGQSELLAVLSGMTRPTAGEILVDGRPVESDANARRLRVLGVGHIPEDRHREGLIMDFPAWECSILGHHDDPTYNGRVLMDRGAVIGLCRALMRDYDVRPPDPWLKAASFSGGNQQKIVVGREMERDPAVLLVGQPTRGVDIGAIEAIHRRLIVLRDRGKAILLVSVELDEIRALSDRILVMFDGVLMGEAAGETADERRLGLMMAGCPAEDIAA
jgi:ABC-type uncharacterized transport system ATPase subunit